MTVGTFLENYVLVICACFSSDVTIRGLSPSSRDTANTGCVIADFRQVDRPPPSLVSTLRRPAANIYRA